QIAADGGPRSIANRFITQDVRLSGGNDLTITGPVDLALGSTFTVFAPVNLTFAGGVGEMTPGLAMAKSGPGFLNLTAPSYISGTFTINTAGGTVALSGGGTLPNVGTITVSAGGSFVIDNSGAGNANNDRVRNVSQFTLNGGFLDFRGNATAPVSEIIGTIQTSSNFTSTISTYSLGQPTKLSANTLTRQANSYASFRGYGADLGSANNQLVFLGNISPLLVSGILPFATLAKAGDLDFATYDVTRGILAATALSTLAGATAKDNVKLTANSAVASPTTVNAVLISGNGVAITGGSQLLIGSGLLASSGAGNSIGAPLAFGGATGLILTPNFASTTSSGSTLDFNAAIDGQQGITKLGVGRATFAAANTQAGVTSIYEGTLRITNSSALGITADNSTAQGTLVGLGAALELDGSVAPLSVNNEFLTLNGVGFGYGQGSVNVLTSGNTGALRSVAGSNTWAGRVDLRQDQGTNYEAIGVDAGTLIVNGIVSSNAGINFSKVGLGTLEFAGSTANTFTGGTFIVNEGTWRFNKTAGVDAVTAFGIQVGDNIGGAGADQLILAASNQINDGATLTVTSSGALNLNNQSDNVNPVVTLNSGLGVAAVASLTTGSGTLTISGGLTVSAQGSTFGNVLPVTVSGTLALTTAGGAAATRTITTNDTIADVDLLLAAKITDGDGNANLQNITTAGSGRLELAPTVASDFSGVFTVNAGRTRISNSSALGASGTGAGTTVNAGFTLEL
ncbi:MAG TPA: autotransporter-associated beta strand repeat-containing protein, partial [Chthoniobacteraceae bacterium]|nr:autotransporter-associated beta strand repeat-containing protein [Chthoniobacteraceae bacterium]